MYYRNTGAPFKRSDGSVVNKGDIFVPTPQELSRRRYKLHPVEVTPEQVAYISTDPPIPAPKLARWALRMAPETYLKLHPTGPHADQARALVDETTDSPHPEESVSDGPKDE